MDIVEWVGHVETYHELYAEHVLGVQLVIQKGLHCDRAGKANKRLSANVGVREKRRGWDSQQTDQTPNEHCTHGLCELCMQLGGSQADGGGGSHDEEEILKGSCRERARSVPGSLSKGGQRGGGKSWGHMVFYFVEYGSPVAWTQTVEDAEAVSPSPGPWGQSARIAETYAKSGYD